MRYGGEEFVVVMPDTDGATGNLVAERLRLGMADKPFKLESTKDPLAVTVSIGVASSHSSHESAASMLERADKAMYAAKNSGRNKVVADDVIGGKADKTAAS